MRDLLNGLLSEFAGQVAFVHSIIEFTLISLSPTKKTALFVLVASRRPVATNRAYLVEALFIAHFFISQMLRHRPGCFIGPSCARKVCVRLDNANPVGLSDRLAAPAAVPVTVLGWPTRRWPRSADRTSMCWKALLRPNVPLALIAGDMASVSRLLASPCCGFSLRESASLPS